MSGGSVTPHPRRRPGWWRVEGGGGLKCQQAQEGASGREGQEPGGHLQPGLTSLLAVPLDPHGPWGRTLVSSERRGNGVLTELRGVPTP